MSKQDYRVRNWREYNQALVNRGSITFWFSEESINNWQGRETTGKRGRPVKYSDNAILCGLTIKAIYKLSLRSTEGFIRSLLEKLELPLDTPDYTLLCKRQDKLDLKLLPKRTKPGEKLNLVVDSSGIKVFGEGEWKVRQHGYIKKRLWRKLHLAVNSSSQEIEAFELTDLGIQDCQAFPKLIEKITQPINSAIGDGAYDRFSCYELGVQNDFVVITPPQRNAVTSEEKCRNRKKASSQAVKNRDDAVLEVRKLGHSEWKKKVGYHKRSLAETAMFRVKTLMGNRLQSKLLTHQRIEVAIWCQAINKMNKLGMPISIVNS